LTHHAGSDFWRCYRKLPSEIRDLADRSYALLKANPSHPSLQFKPIGPYWAVRVGGHYRVLAVRDDETNRLVWFWIGTHAQYDRMIARRS
jgi:mRNA-degrading endonuclease RelE of RelBE toxin-antitoxin system